MEHKISHLLFFICVEHYLIEDEVSEMRRYKLGVKLLYALFSSDVPRDLETSEEKR